MNRDLSEYTECGLLLIQSNSITKKNKIILLGYSYTCLRGGENKKEAQMYIFLRKQTRKECVFLKNTILL